jgi:hypothetical protein
MQQPPPPPAYSSLPRGRARDNNADFATATTSRRLRYNEAVRDLENDTEYLLNAADDARYAASFVPDDIRV